MLNREKARYSVDLVTVCGNQRFVAIIVLLAICTSVILPVVAPSLAWRTWCPDMQEAAIPYIKKRLQLRQGGRIPDLSHHFQHHSHISQGFGANLVQLVISNFVPLPTILRLSPSSRCSLTTRNSGSATLIRPEAIPWGFSALRHERRTWAKVIDSGGAADLPTHYTVAGLTTRGTICDNTRTKG